MHSENHKFTLLCVNNSELKEEIKLSLGNKRDTHADHMKRKSCVDAFHTHICTFRLNGRNISLQQVNS